MAIKNHADKACISTIFFSIIFLTICFIEPRVIFLYPLMISVLSFWNIDRAFEFMIFTLGINYAIFSSNFNIGIFYANSFITTGQVLFFIIGIAKLKRFRIGRNAGLLLMFTIIAFLGIFYSPDTINGIKVLANIVLYAFTILFFVNYRNMTLEKVFTLLIINGIIMFLFIYPMQSLTLDAPLFKFDWERGYRFIGAGVQPVSTAFYMLIIFFASLAMLDKSRKLRYLPAMVAAAIFLLLTNTRVAILGLGGMLIFYLWITRRFFVSIPFIIGLPFLFWESIVDMLFKRSYKYATTGIDFISGGRTIFWEACLRAFEQSPIFGLGLGSSIVTLEDYGVIVPHSEAVRILTELGMIGFFVVILYLASQFLTLKQEFIRSGRSKLTAAVWCLFIFFILASITDSMIDYNMDFTLQLFILIGITNGNAIRQNKGAPR